MSIATLPKDSSIDRRLHPEIASNRPIRVCHVSLTLKTGGLERLLADMARLHDRNTCRHEFLAIEEIGRFADVIRNAGCPVHQLTPAGRIGRVRQMARLFRERRYDAVHTHNTYPHLYATLAARLAGVPVVVQTRHGQRIGHGWRSRLLYRTAARWVDLVVPVSHDAALLTVEDDGVPAEKVRTIWNGIDLDDFEYRGPCRDPIAIGVARLSAEKDFPTLLRAMKLASNELPALRLKLVGDGPERAQLERLTAELELGDRVEFLGDCRDVPHQLTQAAIFVTSSLSEGISLTLLEAMAVGLPTIATTVGGNPEIVLDGVTGKLVPPSDPTALARALIEIGRNPNCGFSMGRAGRERVETHFDVRRMVADYEDIYRELTTKARNRKR